MLQVERKALIAATRPSVWWVTLLGLCGVLLIPLFVVDVPPLLDYPNHLARAFVLASLPTDPVLAAFYQSHWAIIPNLATDLMAPPLLRVLAVNDVGRLLVAAAVLLPVLGTIAYGAALGGRWWCLAVGLAAYDGTLLEGFLNFNLSVGLALLLAAGWIRWKEHHPVATIAMSAAGAIVLFAWHLMGVVFLAILLASAEATQLRAASGHRLGSVLRQATVRMMALGVVFTIPAGLYFASRLEALGGDAAFPPPSAKQGHLLAPFVNYSLALDVFTAVAAVSCAGLCLTLRRGRVPRPAALASGVLLIAYLAAPSAWKGTQQLDTRFAIMLGFMLFAGFVPVGWPKWFRWFVVAASVSLFVARMALLTTAWAQHRADLAELRQALAPILPGQAIYVATMSPTDPAAYWAHAPWSRRLSNRVRTDQHIGALVLIERRAWWPFEFDVPSQQPIVTREPYRSMAERIGDLPDQEALSQADLCGFDAVLATQADAAPSLPAWRFHLLVRAGYAALYAIDVCRPNDETGTYMHAGLAGERLDREAGQRHVGDALASRD
jgi:hypothetical protein